MQLLFKRISFFLYLFKLSHILVKVKFQIKQLKTLAAAANEIEIKFTVQRVKRNRNRINDRA